VRALVVDTSVWIEFFRGKKYPVLDEALGEARVHLPPIVCAELMSGRMNRAQRAQLLDFLADLPLCDTHLTHWCAVGALRESLQRKGLAVSTPDAHVAQCAIDLGAGLLTRDRVFQRVAHHTPLTIV
jgi:predicted nucleic acid-binding protein